MNCFQRCRGSVIKASVLAVFLVSGVALAQDFSSMGISDVVASADRMLQRGDYSRAIPALQEVIRRTSSLTDPAGMGTCQDCRFQLARAYYRTGDIPAGMKVLETYLDNEPRTQERIALRMMAQGFFDTEDWGKIEELAERLLKFPDLEKEDLYNANLLLGQARFRLEKWNECVDPLSYAARYASEDRVKSLCQIMSVRALVEAKDWPKLFGKLPGIYRTEAKYDISLNLTLMKAGRALFEEAGNEADAEHQQRTYLNSLLLYRWVLPREVLVEFSNQRVVALTRKLASDVERGITPDETKERQTEINDINESIKTLEGLPPYEDEVTFRIGQIYAEVKRYWEAFVLFDKLYQDDRTSEIGEGAMLQSVLILYDMKEKARAEERVLRYLNEQPGGQYARTLLSLAMRDNLVAKNFERVQELAPYIDGLPATDDPEEKALHADIVYMSAFGFFQKADYAGAGKQFGIIIDNYKGTDPYAESVYYRGMTWMMQAKYGEAIADFQKYQAENEFGENLAAAMFREAVCQFGLENIEEAEAKFTQFIDTYGSDPLVSEAYSMRGDIEASKPASNEDPYTLDRALGDYRKGIDTATIPAQASYAAFQAAKVYKLEYKWQEIIDLMNYYMNRWEEEANVAEAVFWIGQAQIELGQVGEAVDAYLDAIQRFGDDASQEGIDKIILELVKISNFHLSEENRDGLALKIKLKLTSIDLKQEVLRLRLQIVQAKLQGDDIAAAFGAELLESDLDLSIATPASLALMCDAAADTGNIKEMERLSDYFITNYEESDMLWHAYRAKAFKYLAEENTKDLLWTLEEAQGLFGADPFMGWAQMMRADAIYGQGKYADAEKEYNMIMGVAEWRGPLFAEAMFGMGNCRAALGDLEAAHSFYQRTYLLFKSYDDGNWAAKGYLAAADILIKLGRQEEAIKTLQAMLQDPYTNTNPMAERVRQQLNKVGE